MSGTILTDRLGRPIEYSIKEAKNAVREWQVASGILDCVGVLVPIEGKQKVLTLTASEFMENAKAHSADERRYAYDGTMIEDMPRFMKGMKLCRQEMEEVSKLDRGEWIELFGKPLVREK